MTNMLVKNHKTGITKLNGEIIDRKTEVELIKHICKNHQGSLIQDESMEGGTSIWKYETDNA